MLPRLEVAEVLQSLRLLVRGRSRQVLEAREDGRYDVVLRGGERLVTSRTFAIELRRAVL